MTIKREDIDRREIDFSDVTTGQRLPPIHPGEILRDEFLIPMDLSANRLAKAIKVSPTRLYNILKKESRITGDTALRLGHYFDMTPEFWINLQTRYDLDMARRDIRLDKIEPLSIKPSETGFIYNDKNKFDLSNIKAALWNRKFKKHLQGIAPLGDKYTVLSSSVNDKALILAYNSGNQKNVVQVKCLPKEYDHAGGLGVLDVKNGENGENRWMIVVPVYKVDRDQGNKGAILRYFLSDEKGDMASLTDHQEIISLHTKAYAAGIAQIKNNGVVIAVVIAVVIDPDGKKVKFFKCNNPGEQSEWQWYQLGDIWDVEQVSQRVRKDLDWDPDTKWGDYPNSISLINDGKTIYFIGLNGQKWGIFDKDWVDIYSVDLNTPDDKKRLIKKSNEHVKCSGPVFDGPSFCWGGNARILPNKKIEVLAVGASVHNNRRIRYNKFEIDMNSIN